MTAYERFHAVKPDNRVLVMFGCMGYLHVAKASRVDQKYDETVIPVIFLGRGWEGTWDIADGYCLA
eukprot:1093781-Rhodomonas_salina.1